MNQILEAILIIILMASFILWLLSSIFQVGWMVFPFATILSACFVAALCKVFYKFFLT